MARPWIVGAAVVLFATGCTHDSAGRRIRTGDIRFNERSISGPNIELTLVPNGTWSNLYVQQGVEIRPVQGFGGSGLIPPSGWVDIERRADGLVYEPSWPISNIWTFVTEDGQPIPRSLEAPLYLASQLGLPGARVDIRTPYSEQAGVELKPDCWLILFELQGRQVAAWAVRKGAVCPEPRYPGRDALDRLVAVRNEVWESPYHPQPY